MYLLSPHIGVISPDYTVLIPNIEKIIPEYAEAVLKSEWCRRELRIRVRGIIEGFWRLYTDDFNTITLPVPPLFEQRKIMNYVLKFTREIEEYEERLSSEIEVFQELRIKLISDVVTGRIDVRDIEIPDYEYIEEEVGGAVEDITGDMEDTQDEE